MAIITLMNTTMVELFMTSSTNKLFTSQMSYEWAQMSLTAAKMLPKMISILEFTMILFGSRIKQLSGCG